MSTETDHVTTDEILTLDPGDEVEVSGEVVVKDCPPAPHQDEGDRSKAGERETFRGIVEDPYKSTNPSMGGNHQCHLWLEDVEATWTDGGLGHLKVTTYDKDLNDERRGNPPKMVYHRRAGIMDHSTDVWTDVELDVIEDDEEAEDDEGGDDDGE